jgi:hypothetical protein
MKVCFAYFGFPQGGRWIKGKHGFFIIRTRPNRASRNRSIKKPNSPLFEIARVLVRRDHVATSIVNANHSIAIGLAKLARFS